MKKLWNRLSLRSKILTGTLLLLFLSFALIWGGQLLFFNHYYVYVIKNHVSDAMEQLAADYADWNNDGEINAGIVSYSNDSGAYLMILGENGEILHLVSYEMTVRAEDGETYRFALGTFKHIRANEPEKGIDGYGRISGRTRTWKFLYSKSDSIRKRNLERLWRFSGYAAAKRGFQVPCRKNQR